MLCSRTVRDQQAYRERMENAGSSWASAGDWKIHGSTCETRRGLDGWWDAGGRLIGAVFGRSISPLECWMGVHL